jgi:hypothetical protein
MRLLWIALIASLLAGCAVVPAPYPAEVYGPSVSVGVGVPVYTYPYYYGPPFYGPRHYYVRHYPYGPYRHW